jgi:ParB family chromosome partitioning protein
MTTKTDPVTTQQGTVEHIDPTVIVVEANVRTVAKLDTEFLASIKQNGVLTPILARRDEQGNVIVRAGQLRTLAAREVGLATIPAYIVDADEKVVDRIVQQMAENEHRQAMTDADRVAAYQQLAFEGLTPTVIAKRLGTKTATVKAGIAVAQNGTAASAIVSHSLTLDQAATLIEFEGDDDTVSRLIAEAGKNPGGFAHAAQRARDERKRAAVIAEATVDATARGYVILDRQPSSWQVEDHTSIHDLNTAEGQRVTVESIEAVEGRAVYIDTNWDGDVRVSYYLPTNGFKAAGFKKSSGSGSNSGPMTDEEKAQRRTLIANNKAWISAEVVRRDWLATFLSRKTLPKDAAQFVAQGLTTHGLNVGTAARDGNSLAHTLMGVERGAYYDRDKLAGIVETTPSKAQHVTLAIVLGGIESSTSKVTWRNPTERDSLYFAQLAAWGYDLSDVEQIVVDHEKNRAAAKAAQGEAAQTDAEPVDLEPVEVEQDDTGDDFDEE